jgi:hypothetical protein
MSAIRLRPLGLGHAIDQQVPLRLPGLLKYRVVIGRAPSGKREGRHQQNDERMRFLHEAEDHDCRCQCPRPLPARKFRLMPQGGDAPSG